MVIAILLGLLLLLLRSWKEALILAAATGSQILMFTYIYLPSEQKAMLLIHELIFILWVIAEKKKERENAGWRRALELGGRIAAEVVLALLCLLSLDGHRAAMQQDLQEAYSAGKDAAAFLEAEVPADALIVTAGDVPAYGAAAYAPDRRLWYPLSQSVITFSVWDESREETIGFEEMLERVRAYAPEADSFWLLVGGQNNVEGLDEALADQIPVFSEEAMLSEESIRIYHIEF